MIRLLALLFIISINLSAQIKEDEFIQLKAQLIPDSSETWKSIPWKLSVIDAQQLAAKSNKPIFIWAMDGHPLSCV